LLDTIDLGKPVNILQSKVFSEGFRGKRYGTRVNLRVGNFPTNLEGSEISRKFVIETQRLSNLKTNLKVNNFLTFEISPLRELEIE